MRNSLLVVLFGFCFGIMGCLDKRPGCPKCSSTPPPCGEWKEYPVVVGTVVSVNGYGGSVTIKYDGTKWGLRKEMHTIVLDPSFYLAAVDGNNFALMYNPDTKQVWIDAKWQAKIQKGDAGTSQP